MKQALALLVMAVLFGALTFASSMLRMSGLSLAWAMMGAGAIVALLLLGSQRNKSEDA